MYHKQVKENKMKSEFLLHLSWMQTINGIKPEIIINTIRQFKYSHITNMQSKKTENDPSQLDMMYVSVCVREQNRVRNYRNHNTMRYQINKTMQYEYK